MNKTVRSLLCAVSITIMLSSCSSEAPIIKTTEAAQTVAVATQSKTQPAITTAPQTIPPATTVVITQPPATNATATTPPGTTTPITKPEITTPVTKPPVTKPAVTKPVVTQPVTTKPPKIDDKNYTYVLNTSTKKFHYEGCRAEKLIKDKNRELFKGTREETIRKGYSPCGICKP